MRSTLALLLLFGAVIGVYAVPDPVDTCTLYKVPTDKPCKIEIKWKVHSDVQATATCLEYFPTTFVTGSIVFTNTGVNTGKIKCIVQAAYQCVPKPDNIHTDVFVMYDKCYYFPRKNANEPYVEGTVPDYEKYVGADPKKGRELCKGGKLSVFYSYTQAKFLGMKAKELGLEKLWIGITKDGNTIEEPKTKIHSELWKVVEGSYWDEVAGKLVLKTNPKPNVVPEDAKYYFMRTRNDEFNQRYQGSFERATKTVKASFACEFEAKFTKHQEWYCDKMGRLGLDAVYDEAVESNGFNARCLYVTANKYTWDGSHADMKNIKGCRESPSSLHSSNMDDGTASPEKYEKLVHKGKLRLAGYMTPKTKINPEYTNKDDYGRVYALREAEESWGGADWAYTTQDEIVAMGVQTKCSGAVTDYWKRTWLMMTWRYLNHHGKSQMATDSRIDWNSGYPMNECSDFPGISDTLGLKNGKLIDMPPEVRAPVVCSLAFFQECGNRGTPCGPKVECRNEKEFNPELQGFFSCHCPGPTKDEQDEYNLYTKYNDAKWPNPQSDKDHWKKQPYITSTDTNGAITCKWNPDLPDKACAWLRFYDGAHAYSALLRNDATDDETVSSRKWLTGADFSYSYRFTEAAHNDKLDQVVVRDGCTVTARSARAWYEYHHNKPNFNILSGAGFGTHEVPNVHRHTLGSHLVTQAASNVQCYC